MTMTLLNRLNGMHELHKLRLLRPFCLLLALLFLVPATALAASDAGEAALTRNTEASSSIDTKSSDTKSVDAKGTDAKKEAAPEPPHYYRWVDAKGRTHFSDTPPQGKTHKVKKEALTPAPEPGSGDDLKRIYQRANEILAPPKPAPKPAAGSWGSQLKPAPPKATEPHQSDAPTRPAREYAPH